MAGRLACDKCVIRHQGLCSALSAPELVRLNAIAFRKHVAAGRLILGPGQEPDYCANIISGAVKLSKTLADGRHQIVGLQFAPDFVGRLFGGATTFVAEAATDVELCCFKRGPFEALVQDVPPMKQVLLERALDELDVAREWMVLLGRKSAEERVASFILMIAERQRRTSCAHDEGNGTDNTVKDFDLPLSRTEMGEYLGLTIETVSRQFKKLRSTGVLAMRGIRNASVTDLEALRRLAEHEAV